VVCRVGMQALPFRSPIMRAAALKLRGRVVC
jgi:hypothetical protein